MIEGVGRCIQPKGHSVGYHSAVAVPAGDTVVTLRERLRTIVVEASDSYRGEHRVDENEYICDGEAGFIAARLSECERLIGDNTQLVNALRALLDACVAPTGLTYAIPDRGKGAGSACSI